MVDQVRQRRREVRRFRWLMGVVIVGLVASGVTAFPLLWEMEVLGAAIGLPEGWVGSGGELSDQGEVAVTGPTFGERGLPGSGEGGGGKSGWDHIRDGFRGWIFEVRGGLRETYARYPWVGYGTDWLAFGHLVIALFFVGPLVWPERDHRATLLAGVVACVAVVPTAMIAGEVRGIPWGWRGIDCLFGVFGLVPLVWAWRVHGRVLGRGGCWGRGGRCVVTAPTFGERELPGDVGCGGPSGVSRRTWCRSGRSCGRGRRLGRFRRGRRRRAGSSSRGDGVPRSRSRCRRGSGRCSCLCRRWWS